MRVVVMVLLAGCFISPVMPIGGPKKSRQQLQYETASKLTPPAIGVEDDYKGEVKTVKLRVYGDDEHRAQTVRWQQAFGEQLDFANEVLAAQFGVKFVAEYKTWNYRPPPGEPLETVLNALRAEDPGSDVFGVVALTSAQTIVTGTFDQIGYAFTPGKHMVLRGFADRGERAAFEQSFKELKADQRDWLYQARRRHKLLSVFLHELGHNLGADHRAEPNTIMSPTYSHQAAGFDASSREIIQRTLDGRLGRAPKVAPGVQPTGHATLVIVVDENGNRMIGGNAVDDATLDGLLKLHYADDKDTEVLIRTKDKAPQTVVLAIVQRAKAVGLQTVSISRD
jgi:hypothetical protein